MSIAFRADDHGQKERGSKYTLTVKAEALAVMTACRDNHRAAEKVSGVSARTLKRWQAQAAQNDTLAELAAVKKGALAGKVENLMDAMLASITQHADSATVKDIPAFCQLFDRWFMLTYGVEQFERARAMTRREVTKR